MPIWYTDDDALYTEQEVERGDVSKRYLRKFEVPKMIVLDADRVVKDGYINIIRILEHNDIGRELDMTEEKRDEEDSDSYEDE